MEKNNINIKYYLQLIRAKNCLTAFFGTFISGLIASNFNLEYTILYNIFIASLVVFLICGYGNGLNDIEDIEIDKINKPERPLPSNKISLKDAKLFCYLLLILGLVLSLFNYLCFIMALINSIILYFYAKKYKKNKIIGNFIVAYLTGSIFIFGGIAVNNIGITIILFLCGLFATWSREIIKDYEDIVGDKKEGVITLPIKYGKKSIYIALLFLLFAIILSPLPYLLGIFGIYYLILITICNLLFLLIGYNLLKNITNKKTFSKSQKNIKIVMNLVLLCFIIGSLIK